MRDDLRRTAREGFIAGLIGYAIIVLFFTVLDLVEGRSPFHTAAVLGTAFSGAPVDAFRVEPGVVLAYNGLHLLAFLALGFVSARVAAGVERFPRAFFGVFYFGLFGFILATTMIYAFAARTGPRLSFWAIDAGMLLAVGGMLTWLLAMHPGLRRSIRRLDALDEVDANGLSFTPQSAGRSAPP